MTYQAYLDTIKKRTGKTPEDFRALAKKKGLLASGTKASQVVAWLKEDFGLGHGHAMAMYGAIKPTDVHKPTADEEVARHFSGRRAEWKKPYGLLMAKLGKFGTDISEHPTNSYISVLRQDKKFAIVQVTGDRLDVGLKLKGIEPSSRLTPAGAWNAMVTHRVSVTSPTELDAELLRWLRMAYDRA